MLGLNDAGARCVPQLLRQIRLASPAQDPVVHRNFLHQQARPLPTSKPAREDHLPEDRRQEAARARGRPRRALPPDRPEGEAHDPAAGLPGRYQRAVTAPNAAVPAPPLARTPGQPHPLHPGRGPEPPAAALEPLRLRLALRGPSTSRRCRPSPRTSASPTRRCSSRWSPTPSPATPRCCGSWTCGAWRRSCSARWSTTPPRPSSAASWRARCSTTPGAPLRGAAGQLLDHLCGCAFWGQGPRTPASYLAWGLRYLGHHSAPGVRLLAGLLQDPDAQQMAAEGLVAAAGADPSLLPELLACLPVSHASCDAVLQVAEELAFAPDMAAFFVARCGEMVPLCASFERRAAFLDCLRACIAHLSAEDYLDLGGCLTGLLAAWDDEDLRERMDLMGEDFGVQLGWYWRVQQW
uniref:Uncharacterized protein n=1 Tax=Spironucleus salmonicida TaxID=348837 RepID=V6LYC3_9EUKA|eukprot:EST48701.1 Hypothetical protein SS50377_11111 [Spironucleus salmonicida]